MVVPARCKYYGDNGDVIPAILYKVARSEINPNQIVGWLVLNLSTAPGLHYIGKEGWFDTTYVGWYGGMVPECADMGKEPGQWEPYV